MSQKRRVPYADWIGIRHATPANKGYRYSLLRIGEDADGQDALPLAQGLEIGPDCLVVRPLLEAVADRL